MANENAAEVLEQDGPNTQDNAEELAAAAAPRAGEVDPQATENEHDDEIKPKRTGGYVRKLIKAEQERDFWRDEALRNRTSQPQAQNPAAQEAKPPVKPKATDFTGPDAWEKYEEARDKWVEDLADFKAKEAVKQYRTETEQRSEHDKVANSFAQQCAAAKAKYPDFEDVAFSEDTPMTTDVAKAVSRSEFGAEIAYYLGQHQDQAQKIAEMNPYDAIREIGKIESRITGTKPADDKEPDEAPAATTRAPRPPSPVRRTTSVNQDPDDKDDYKTWLRKREAQLARK